MTKPFFTFTPGRKDFVKLAAAGAVATATAATVGREIGAEQQKIEAIAALNEQLQPKVAPIDEEPLRRGKGPYVPGTGSRDDELRGQWGLVERGDAGLQAVGTNAVVYDAARLSGPSMNHLVDSAVVSADGVFVRVVVSEVPDSPNEQVWVDRDDIGLTYRPSALLQHGDRLAREEYGDLGQPHDSERLLKFHPYLDLSVVKQIVMRRPEQAGGDYLVLPVKDSAHVVFVVNAEGDNIPVFFNSLQGENYPGRQSLYISRTQLSHNGEEFKYLPSLNITNLVERMDDGTVKMHGSKALIDLAERMLNNEQISDRANLEIFTWLGVNSYDAIVVDDRNIMTMIPFRINISATVGDTGDNRRTVGSESSYAVAVFNNSSEPSSYGGIEPSAIITPDDLAVEYGIDKQRDQILKPLCCMGVGEFLAIWETGSDNNNDRYLVAITAQADGRFTTRATKLPEGNEAIIPSRSGIETDGRVMQWETVALLRDGKLSLNYSQDYWIVR